MNDPNDAAYNLGKQKYGEPNFDKTAELIISSFSTLLIERRKDFAIAKGDIGYFTIDTIMEKRGGETVVLYNISMIVEGLVVNNKRQRGQMAHVFHCLNLGHALEEAHRRASFNLVTGAK